MAENTKVELVNSAGDAANPATGIGAPADAAATTDAGTFSLISLFKRLLEKATAGFGVTGTAAHDAAISGAPVRIGGRAITAALAAVAHGDAVDLVVDKQGRQIVKFGAPSDMEWRYSGTITDNAQAIVRAAPGVGLQNCVSAFQYQNKHASVATIISLQAGAGAVVALHAPANMTVPAVIFFPQPIRCGDNAATNVQMTTTGADVMVNAQGYIERV